MSTTQISIRIPKALHLMALLLAAQKECTVTDVLLEVVGAALETKFLDVPADAKGHLAEMASRKDVDMIDARVAIRLAVAGVESGFEQGTLFHVKPEDLKGASAESGEGAQTDGATGNGQQDAKGRKKTTGK